MASGGHRVDTAKVAALVGASSVDRASPEFVRSTPASPSRGRAGRAPGAAAHPGRHRARAYDEVWAAAGHPHTVFPTTYAELLRITGGEPADVGAD
jgi:prolyl-tRNA editing enzyme YbaK/EbsC (Cys-tRNA(Pro) deacylase)